MPSHKIQSTGFDRLKSAVPFGLGQVKPKHFREMAKVFWKNRDNLPYALKVLRRGVCDGCALGVAGFHDWTIQGVHLCMTRLNLLRLNTMPGLDARRLEDIAQLKSLDNAQLRELGRLPFPMLREKGAKGFRRISWEDAYQRIAKKIRAADPRRWAMFVTSRGVTNEVYYMAQKAARFLGTNNVDNAARLCHAPSTAAMKHALGVAATTCSYKDWYGTDLVIFFGANPANDQPVATKYLHEAKKLGTKVVLVNPYLEPGMKRYWVPSTLGSALFGTDIADYWFPVSQGGDIAFLCGVLKILVSNGWLDERFIRDHTVGFDELKSGLSKASFAELETQAGLDRAAMQEFAELIRDAKTAVLVWSMGITQHAAALSGLYGFPVPDWIGLTAPEMVEAAARGQLVLLYCLGGNFLRTLPEPDYVRRALENLPMRVHQDIILSDQMFIEAQEEVILLPAKTRYEQDDGGTETSTERRVMFSPEIPRQVGEARAEWKILREVAAAVHPERAHLLACETGPRVREEIARVIPFYDGIQNLRETGDAFQYGGQHLCADWKFPTPDGKAHFRAVPLPAPIPSIGGEQGVGSVEGTAPSRREFSVST